MNYRIVCLTLGLPAILLLTGCLSKGQPLIPVTGADDASIPAMVELVRENVLEYVISSSRLATAPPSVDWRLKGGQPLEGEYRFHSGDWLMVIWLADADKENQRVVIINKVENAYWCGYVEPHGQVVDTSYTR